MILILGTAIIINILKCLCIVDWLSSIMYISHYYSKTKLTKKEYIDMLYYIHEHYVSSMIVSFVTIILNLVLFICTQDEVIKVDNRYYFIDITLFIILLVCMVCYKLYTDHMKRIKFVKVKKKWNTIDKTKYKNTKDVRL